VVPGTGTLLNMATVLIGSGLGVALGGRLPERTRTTVTDALGLVTLVIGALNVAALSDPAFRAAVGDSAPLLIVLGALLLGGIGGSLLGLEARLERSGAWLQRRLSGTGSSGRGSSAARERFVEGYVSASLVFVVGPLAILGPLSDGLGRGIDQLALKSTLDGFAALAFAASFGWGVAASAISVGVVQGLLTLLGALLGGLLPEALVSSVTATGGVLLLGVGLRLLALKAVAVGDMLPALVAAPVLTAVVQALR
jgi:uncharacterized membrane protein YqgA involved in biofilm formation